MKEATRGAALIIARKELARFFSNKASAAVSILLPGLLVFAVYTLMGNALSSMADDARESACVVAAHLPQSVEPALAAAGIDVQRDDAIVDADAARERAGQGGGAAVAVFPEDFDAAVASFDSASGQAAPQVSIYYDSSDAASAASYTMLVAALDSYESALANRFDVNADAGEAYDVAERAGDGMQAMTSFIPMLLLILVFSGCMSVAAESIAGEKERGTMATLLATPIARRDIALGKMAALGAIGLAVAASSAIGVFASLPALMQGELDLGTYGAAEYGTLAVAILSATFLTVMLIMVVSALAKSTKEAQLYLTPLMVVVMGIGLAGMLGGGSAQGEWWFYLIPLYNCVQCMIGALSFDVQPLNLALCVMSNLAYTAIGALALQRMFSSERLMFKR